MTTNTAFEAALLESTAATKLLLQILLSALSLITGFGSIFFILLGGQLLAGTPRAESYTDLCLEPGGQKLEKICFSGTV